MNWKRATGRVTVSASARINENRKLFQLKMIERIDAVAMPGTASGREIRRKHPNSVSPSTCPASSSSAGKDLKNPVMIQVTKGRPTNMWLRISTGYPPTNPSWEKRKYHGTRRRIAGTTLASRTTALKPPSRKRAIAHAAGTPRTIERSVEPIPT